MSRAKKVAFLAGIAMLVMAAKAKAVDMDWSDNKCLTIDHTFRVCKPDGKWDTQKTGESTAPVKWVFHKTGANPVIWLQYDENAQGKTAHDYAQSVKSRLKARGVNITATRNTQIAGRNVSMIYGDDPVGGFRYMVGVWRNKNKGFTLQSTAAATDFAAYEPHFMTSVSSVRIVNEH